MLYTVLKKCGFGYWAQQRLSDFGYGRWYRFDFKFWHGLWYCNGVFFVLKVRIKYGLKTSCIFVTGKGTG